MFNIRSSWRALFQSELNLPPLSGDAFVFGAAPNPVVPEALIRTATIATANASQLSLEAYGVDKPHITFMRTNMSKGRDVDMMKLQGLRDRQTGLLVLLAREDSECREQLALLSQVNYRADNVLIASAIQTEMLQNRVLGTRRQFLLQHFRLPSMGLQAVLFCLGMGARCVAVSGVSFRADGCSFNDLQYKRKHVDGDRAIVAHIRQRGLPVYAIEDQFAVDTSLQHWTPMVVAA